MSISKSFSGHAFGSKVDSTIEQTIGESIVIKINGVVENKSCDDSLVSASSASLDH